MTDSDMDFGALDLGGPKDAPPSPKNDIEAELTNESIKRKKFSRWFALTTLLVMSLSAVGCLGFAMYVGCHFLGVLENSSKLASSTTSSTATSTQPVPAAVAVSLPNKQEAQANANVKELPKDNKATSAVQALAPEGPYIKLLAPLIPATFSSALAIILFITIARFVTNFERIGKEGSEKEQPEDYGAIAALVQEIGKMIQSLRGKNS